MKLGKDFSTGGIVGCVVGASSVVALILWWYVILYLHTEHSKKLTGVAQGVGRKH